MLKMARTKQDKIVIKVPDARHMQYFKDALTVSNNMRSAQNLGQISMETFALNALIAGSNQVIEWFVNQAKQAETTDVTGKPENDWQLPSQESDTQLS